VCSERLETRDFSSPHDLKVAVANAIQKTTAGAPGCFESFNVPLDPIASHAIWAKRGLSPAKFDGDVHVADHGNGWVKHATEQPKLPDI
jgi:hypothetical protein